MGQTLIVSVDSAQSEKINPPSTLDNPLSSRHPFAGFGRTRKEINAFML